VALECTQPEYDALASAIKQGVMLVSYADKTVRYQSLGEMRAVLAEMGEYLAGSSAAPAYSRASFSRE
jgi:hypothetical protein